AERLARKQAEAAAERRSDQPRDPNEELQAQRLRRQIEEETRQLRAGADAQREKQQALEALERLGQENPQRQAQAQREAADAMRRLADKLAGRDDPAAKAA